MEAEEQANSHWNNGSTRCPSVRAYGRPQQSQLASWYNATSSRPSSSSTVFAPSSSNHRYTFPSSLPLSPAHTTPLPHIPPTNTLLKTQYWRILTPFLYFGPLNLDLLFHVFFQQRYSRLLEESSGRSPAHFAWLLLYASSVLLLLSPLLSIPFLGSALSSTLVYIWSRRNPDTRLSFLGLLVFTAPYLPWVLMAFSLVLHGIVPKDEIAGVVVGHGMAHAQHLFAQHPFCLHLLLFFTTRLSHILKPEPHTDNRRE